MRHEERQARKLEGQGCTQRGLDTSGSPTGGADPPQSFERGSGMLGNFRKVASTTER